MLRLAAAFLLLVVAAPTKVPAQVQIPEPPANRFIAVFETNANVDGESYVRGFQAFAVRYERASGKVYIDDRGRIVAVPAKFVRLIPEEKAGLSIISAEYRQPGQRAKNVTALMQRKFNGHQKVTLIVAGSLFGVRPVEVPITLPPEIGQNRPNTAGQIRNVGATGQLPAMPQNQFGNNLTQLPATLEVTYAYRGQVSSVAAPEGHPISMP